DIVFIGEVGASIIRIRSNGALGRHWSGFLIVILPIAEKQTTGFKSDKLGLCQKTGRP
ncbi:MAG: hypothetical protein ACI92E_002691, partial [Oceanicoccus sp.]